MLESQQLKFPLICPYRIIAKDIPNIKFVIETVLMQLGVSEKLEDGQRSEKGNYVSFRVDVMVDSRERMNKITEELRKIEGVKMVI